MKLFSVDGKQEAPYYLSVLTETPEEALGLFNRFIDRMSKEDFDPDDETTHELYSLEEVNEHPVGQVIAIHVDAA